MELYGVMRIPRHGERSRLLAVILEEAARIARMVYVEAQG
jgi:hypothetical protein